MNNQPTTTTVISGKADVTITEVSYHQRQKEALLKELDEIGEKIMDKERQHKHEVYLLKIDLSAIAKKIKALEEQISQAK